MHKKFVADLFLGTRQWRLGFSPPFWPQRDAANGHDWCLRSRIYVLRDIYTEKFLNKFFYKKKLFGKYFAISHLPATFLEREIKNCD